MERSSKLLYRVDEVCEILGLSRSKVYELVANGDIPMLKIGRSARVSRAALEKWLNSLREAPLNEVDGDATSSQ